MRAGSARERHATGYGEGEAVTDAAAGLICAVELDAGADGEDVGPADGDVLGAAVVGPPVGDVVGVGELVRVGRDDGDFEGLDDAVFDGAVVVGPEVGPELAAGSCASSWPAASSTRTASASFSWPARRAFATAAFRARRSSRAAPYWCETRSASIRSRSVPRRGTWSAADGG